MFTRPFDRTRRTFLAALLSATAADLVSAAGLPTGGGIRIGIVGAGVGGLTAARYLNMLMPRAHLVVFEPDRRYHACFKSNEALAGIRPDSDLLFGYDAWKKRTEWIAEAVASVETGVIVTERGSRHAFDWIVVSTGVQFRYDRIDGLSAARALDVPHAWAGKAQYDALRAQLVAMRDGGVVLIAPPKAPYKCPPGPFERASLVAHYLRHHKPNAKIIIADGNENFSKQPLFQRGWERLYGFGAPQSLIERISGGKGGRVVSVDVASRRVTLENGESIRADVCNLIPPQYAGAMPERSGLADESGWCPVDKATMESTRVAGVYVVGDACDAASMPKSAFSATSQAKACAFAIAAAAASAPPPTPRFMNACFSLLEPGYGISIAHHYAYEKAGNRITQLSGGTTSIDASDEDLSREAAFSEDWFSIVTRQLFA
ncbi:MULTISPECIES: NAD(P)/FAD-dependent oxidoreductase [Burkholderia]|uniref:NAD(P)/FAD-dependent oxidoreductase n=1 Tax=Burkholderia TaxID=32008 RepID=UPI0008420153|nr:MULTISPECIES: NAD(P)/FAD-dependent oxidoreductase [unclassified Burkholderia]AOK29719.1 pyridine nucleotide-disulfide oxidoreductase [Burkholderia sp. Bp7605]